MRSSGSVVGVAIVIVLRPHSLVNSRCHMIVIIGLILSYILIGCLDLIPMATEITLFYIQSLCICSAVPIIVTIIDIMMTKYTIKH